MELLQRPLPKHASGGGVGDSGNVGGDGGSGGGVRRGSFRCLLFGRGDRRPPLPPPPVLRRRHLLCYVFVPLIVAATLTTAAWHIYISYMYAQ